MPFVSVVNHLFEAEDKTPSNKPENKETNTTKKGSENTNSNAR